MSKVKIFGNCKFISIGKIFKKNTQIFDEIFDEIFEQIFEQIFNQIFDKIFD